MQLKDLKPNKRNPRRISAKKLEQLKASLVKFGDLSGFVYNRRTKNLVSGHQRQKSLPPNATIKIESKYEKPTKSMTVAEGFVVVDGEHFKYREVDADPQWEMEALLAANKHGGEWDTDLLKLTMADFPKLDWAVAGFDALELDTFGLVDLKEHTQELKKPEQSDEEYVRSEVKTEERIPTEDELLNGGAPPSENPFEKAESKKMDVTGRRFVIIIDCASEEAKQSLKEKLLPHVNEAGAKFF